MNKFAGWLPDIHANPREWLAPVIRSGDIDLALELIRNNPHLLNARFSGNETLLLVAAYSRQLRIADALLEMGARIDLIAAVALARNDVVREMLHKEPRLAYKHAPNNGLSAIHVSAGYGNHETMGLLISAGADVNFREPRGCTPLFFASSEPYANAEILLVNGADANARAKHGFTPLHCAAASGNAGFVRFLIEHGADRDVQTVARQTPWAFAVRYRHWEIAGFLGSR